MGISAPIYGRIYADMFLESPVRLSRFLQPRVEPELAVVLRDDLPGQVGPEVALSAVGGVFLGWISWIAFGQGISLASPRLWPTTLRAAVCYWGRNRSVGPSPGSSVSR